MKTTPCKARLDLEKYSSQIESIFDIYITLKDFTGLFVYLSDFTNAESRIMHRSPFCKKGKYSFRDWNKRCINDCNVALQEILEASPFPTVKECWKGVSELVVPVVCTGQIIGAVLGGPFRQQQNSDKIPAECRKLFQSLPLLDEKKIESLALLMFSLSSNISSALTIRISRLPLHENRRAIVLRYLIEYTNRPTACLEDLADKMALSKSRASHLIKEIFGMPFRTLLINERLRRAKYLLETTEFSLAEIASRVGLCNEFYFNRFFSKHLGISPGKYRKKPIKKAAN